MHKVRLTERRVPDLGRVAAEATNLTPADQERFWSLVRRGESNACWPWTGRCAGGKGDWYGQFRFGGHSLYAHRIVWILTHGTIPCGQFVCHRCDRPTCCNPAHLFLGTHTDNMRDAAAKGRLHVPRPRRQKLTVEQLKEIDALLSLGVARVKIARHYGVSKTWVCLYAKGLRRQYDRPAKPRKTKAA